MKLFFSTLLASGISMSLVAAQDADIPTTAVEAGAFTTLVTALGAADLVGALSAPNGPFTVFAPTDDAFAALPAELIACVLEPENVDVLTSLLTYHVVEGSVLSTDLVDGMMAETLSTESVMIGVGDSVTVNGVSTVVTPDIATSNGVIHVIDSGKV